jgi:hypothetical protein
MDGPSNDSCYRPSNEKCMYSVTSKSQVEGLKSGCVVTDCYQIGTCDAMVEMGGFHPPR